MMYSERNQEIYDQLGPEDFLSNYEDELDEVVTDPKKAVQTLHDALFENDYLDQELLWESLVCLGYEHGNDEITDYPMTQLGMTVVKKEHHKLTIDRLKAEKQELVQHIQRAMTCLRDAIYGDGEISNYNIDSAMQNIAYLTGMAPQQDRKLNITRKA